MFPKFCGRCLRPVRFGEFEGFSRFVLRNDAISRHLPMWKRVRNNARYAMRPRVRFSRFLDKCQTGMLTGVQ